MVKNKYTVLLLRPESIAGTFGHDTYCAWIEAKNVRQAVKEAREDAITTDDSLCAINCPEDYYLLFVGAGHIDDLTYLHDVKPTRRKKNERSKKSN